MRIIDPGDDPRRGSQAAPPAAEQPGASSAAAPLPGAHIYAAKQAQAQKAYDDAIADLNRRRSRTLQNYGFLESGEMDANNQFGIMQQMFREQAQGMDATEMGQRGRGFANQGGNLSGLAARASTNMNYDQALERLKTSRGYEDEMYDIAQARTQAENTKSSAFTQAEQDQFEWAQANNQYTPAAPPAVSALPSKAAAKKNAVKVKTKKKKGK